MIQEVLNPKTKNQMLTTKTKKEKTAAVALMAQAVVSQEAAAAQIAEVSQEVVAPINQSRK